MTIETINPATGELIKKYQEFSQADVNKIIDSVHTAYLQWKEVPLKIRTEKMHKAAAILNQNVEKYAKIISDEMGKPIAAARNEIKKCAWVCEHYADNAADYLKPRQVKTEMSKSYVTYQPLGIVFAIMPWNFPFWQVFRFAAPTLMAGNAALLKHAPISTGAGLAIEEVFRLAGFPENLFRTLILDNDGAAKVIQNKKVIAVTLTGSAGAGSVVGAEAAKSLKKVVLELGGSDPYIILADADLEKAAEACVTSRMSNSGQVCISAKRIILVDAIKDKFKQLVLEKIKRYEMGNPAEENCNFGPMAREDLRDELHVQVQATVKAGAKVLLGAEIPKRKGFYYPPTVLDNIQPGMVAYEQELFGPVICFINVANEAEALKVANDTSYGLAGAVFTQDIAKGEKIAAEIIQAGACAVNGFVASDPRLPFGGIKESGYGRELSAEGIRAFMNTKTVMVY